MQVARLHGPKDIRIATEPAPPPPAPGEVTLAISTVGLCGSDLHMYESGRIGYTALSNRQRVLRARPRIHGSRVAAVGEGALDGNHQPLRIGQRVAVEPARALLALRTLRATGIPISAPIIISTASSPKTAPCASA